MAEFLRDAKLSFTDLDYSALLEVEEKNKLAQVKSLRRSLI